MTAAYRVTVAERQDLLFVTIICTQCSTELTLKIDTAQPPQNCASCGAALEENAKNALVALNRFHREAKAAETLSSKHIFRFEIKEKS